MYTRSTFRIAEALQSNPYLRDGLRGLLFKSDEKITYSEQRFDEGQELASFLFNCLQLGPVNSPTLSASEAQNIDGNKPLDQEDARAAVTEAYWQGKQGEDYGTF